MGGMTLALPGIGLWLVLMFGRPVGLRTERDLEMLVHEMLMVCGVNGKVNSILIVFWSENEIADVILRPGLPHDSSGSGHLSGRARGQ
jgi:hypothetical protein